MADQIDILDFIASKPEVLWGIALIGAVCVIGIVDFLKCWVKRKSVTKWIVFFVSLGIAIVLSPLVPPLISAIVILWLLILALATISYNAIVNGLPNFISKMMGSISKDTEGGK